MTISPLQPSQSLILYDSSSSASVQTDDQKKKKKHKKTESGNPPIFLGHGEGYYPKSSSRERPTLEAERGLSPREIRRLEKEAMKIQKRELEKSFHGHSLIHSPEGSQITKQSSKSLWEKFISQSWWAIAAELALGAGAIGGGAFLFIKKPWIKSKESLSDTSSSKDNLTPRSKIPPADQSQKLSAANLQAIQNVVSQSVKTDNGILGMLKAKIPFIPGFSSSTQRIAQQIEDYKSAETIDKKEFHNLLNELMSATIEENRLDESFQLFIKMPDEQRKQLSSVEKLLEKFIEEDRNFVDIHELISKSDTQQKEKLTAYIRNLLNEMFIDMTKASDKTQRIIDCKYLLSTIPQNILKEHDELMRILTYASESNVAEAKNTAQNALNNLSAKNNPSEQEKLLFCYAALYAHENDAELKTQTKDWLIGLSKSTNPIVRKEAIQLLNKNFVLNPAEFASLGLQPLGMLSPAEEGLLEAKMKVVDSSAAQGLISSIA